MIADDIISEYSIIQRNGKKYIDFPINNDIISKNNVLEIYDEQEEDPE